MESEFLSCDWGTTSFRLRWVSGQDRRIIREIRENAGVKSLHDESTRTNTPAQPERTEVFARFLSAKLGALLAGEKPPAPALPLVISGMASSSIGWREVPYAKAPLALDGRTLRLEELSWSKPGWVGPTYLISGVANERDMMRGEETEIIGLMSDPNLSALCERSLLILPGTHSKHVRVEDRCIVDFCTFMTGELFEVLARHSLLRASVEMDQTANGDTLQLSEADREAFQEGVRWAQNRGLAGGLFRVRTRSVLDECPLANNAWFMSGLLIGAEIKSIREHANDCPVILAATRGLSKPYSLALEIVAGSAIQWTCLPPAQVEQATVSAHALFLRNRTAAAEVSETAPLRRG